MKYIKLHFLLFFCFVSLITYSQEEVKVKIIKSKTRFQVGEPILFNLEIENTSDKDLSLCTSSSYNAYSFRYSSDAHWISEHSTAGRKYVTFGSSHSDEGDNPLKREVEVSRESDEEYCRYYSLTDNFYLKNNGKTFFPILINECGLDSAFTCIGRYDFMLPVGKYRLDIHLIFNNSSVVDKSVEFEIVEASDELTAKVMDYTEGLKYYLEAGLWKPKKYRTYKIGDAKGIHSKLIKTKDSIIINKILLYLSSSSFDKEQYLFFVNNVYRASNDLVLYYLLNKIADKTVFVVLDFSVDPIEVFNIVLRTLKSKKPEFAGYFYNRLIANYGSPETWHSKRLKFFGKSINLEDLKIPKE